MKTLIILIIVLSSRLASASLSDSILIGLGENKRIELKGANNVWIENKQVITATASDGSVIVKGLHSGESLIRIGNQTYKVQIVHPSQLDSFSSLRLATKNLLGLSADAFQGQIIVKGKLYSLNNWKKLALLKLQYQMRAEISDSVQDQAQEYFKSLMKKERLPRLNVLFSDAIEMRVNPKSIYLERYKNLLSSYGIQVIPDADVLESAPTIKVQITVAEIKNRFNMDYGIKWPSGYTAQVFGGIKKVDDDLGVLAKAIEDQSYGKILASPNIVCRSGKEAEFFAGGEIPIVVRTHKSQEIVWKKYGVVLKVKPHADSSGRMSISIETEVSTLDTGTKIGEIPGVMINRVSSYFDLNKPQTIALSGLIKNENSNSHSGVPFLSRLPILGPLFASHDFQNLKSELVIFVRPTILEDEEVLQAPAHLGGSQWK